MPDSTRLDSVRPGVLDQAVAHLAEENARLRRDLDAATAELHPAGKYRCGCPLVRSRKVEAFCPDHMALIADEPEDKA